MTPMPNTAANAESLFSNIPSKKPFESKAAAKAASFLDEKSEAR
jgi:hypothetical protein